MVLWATNVMPVIQLYQTALLLFTTLITASSAIATCKSVITGVYSSARFSTLTLFANLQCRLQSSSRQERPRRHKWTTQSRTNSLQLLVKVWLRMVYNTFLANLQERNAKLKQAVEAKEAELSRAQVTRQQQHMPASQAKEEQALADKVAAMEQKANMLAQQLHNKVSRKENAGTAAA